MREGEKGRKEDRTSKKFANLLYIFWYSCRLYSITQNFFDAIQLASAMTYLIFFKRRRGACFPVSLLFSRFVYDFDTAISVRMVQGKGKLRILRRIPAIILVRSWRNERLFFVRL